MSVFHYSETPTEGKSLKLLPVQLAITAPESKFYEKCRLISLNYVHQDSKFCTENYFLLLQRRETGQTNLNTILKVGL